MMKKKAGILIGAAALLVLSGCGKGTAVQEPDPVTVEDSE